MLHLLESAAGPHGGRTPWTMASALTHATVITLVVMAGAGNTVPDPAPRVVPDEIVYRVATPEPERVPSAPVATPRPAIAGDFRIPAVPLPAVGNTISPPTPLTLPGAPRWPAAVLPLTPGVPGGVSPDGAFSERLVDRAVRPLPDHGQPAYPAMLRGAAVEGEVLVRFIVDARGRVEPRSVQVVRATHELFAESVRRWLPRNRYLPAEVAGVPVRQVVEQRIGFTLR